MDLSWSWWLSTFTITVTLLGLAMGLLQGCAGPSFYPRVIQETEDRYVRLEARYGPGQEGEALRFSHPVTLSEAEWSRILEGVRVKPHRWFLPIGDQEVTLQPVFDDDDRQYLATYLAKAFSQARRDEWALFYMSHLREAQVVEVTSGGFFVEGDHLHFVLANYHQPVSMSFIQKGIWDDPLRPTGDTYSHLVAEEHQTLHTYRRWYPTKPVLAFPSELVIDYKSLLRADNVTTPTSTPERDAGGIRTGKASEFEEKLRLLRRLHEEGLISNEEYRMKRGRLLDEL